jgi:hypothetical protein
MRNRSIAAGPEKNSSREPVRELLHLANTHA